MIVGIGSMPSSSNAISEVSDFRPIALLEVMFKLYLCVLFIQVSRYIKFNNPIQIGARKHHTCIEIVHTIRLICEKCFLWGLSLVLISIDVAKAFDCLDLQAVIDCLSRYQVPVRLSFAILREILAIKSFSFTCIGEYVGPFPILRGLRQGSPLSSFLFAIIVGDILSALDRKWKRLGFGIRLGQFGGNDLAFAEFWDEHQDCFRYIDIDNFNDVFVSCLNFLDDVYLFAGSVLEAQVMLDDLCHEFWKVGLVLNPSKIKWTLNKHARAHAGQPGCLTVAGVLIPPCNQFVCLGSVISHDLYETHAFEHRIQRSWLCFHKWASVLMSEAPLVTRLEFWSRVVGPSLLWGLETTRDQSHTKAFKRLITCQRMQIVKMLKCKRRPVNGQTLETWVEYRIRSFRTARKILQDNGLNVSETLMSKKLKWAGHLARFGLGPREPHLLKHVAAWRCRFWWEAQSLYNNLDWNPIKHHPMNGRPRRWEKHFSTNWMVTLAEVHQD